MSSFDWKKNTEESIKIGLIITATNTGIFSTLKVENVKPPKASLDAMNIMKLAGGRCGGVIVKDYVVKKNGPTNDTSKILWPLRAMTKIQLELVTLRWATAPSRLNT